MSGNSRPVYSTSSGRLCPECTYPVADCHCKLHADAARSNPGVVYISRERKGRGGKDVTVIKGLALNVIELKLLASDLKARCASGGTIANGMIEIQGDHRLRLKQALEAKSYQVKLSGG